MFRKTTSFLISVFILTGAICMATGDIAHAYIDAGTGSLVLQMLVAGFFGSLFALKLFWRRLADRISAIFRKSPPRDSERS